MPKNFRELTILKPNSFIKAKFLKMKPLLKQL